MKICPNCQHTVADDAAFCATCGTAFAVQAQPQPQVATQVPPTPAYTVVPDPYDHTAEFDAKDISDNKVISMLVYLMGAIGIIIALLVGNSSPYAAFHVRQALKITVVEILAPIVLMVCAVVCIIPILGWIAYALALLAYVVLAMALFVVKIMAFFSICNGKAKEPAIVRELKFLK